MLLVHCSRTAHTLWSMWHSFLCTRVKFHFIISINSALMLSNLLGDWIPMGCRFTWANEFWLVVDHAKCDWLDVTLTWVGVVVIFESMDICISNEVKNWGIFLHPEFFFSSIRIDFSSLVLDISHTCLQSHIESTHPTQLFVSLDLIGSISGTATFLNTTSFKLHNFNISINSDHTNTQSWFLELQQFN